MNPAIRFSSALVVLAGVAQVAVTLSCQGRTATQTGYLISGRVVDPHRLRPEAAVLMLGREEDGGFGSVPVPVGADGSFTTRRLPPATYALEVVRTPNSSTKPATVVGLSLVSISAADMTGVEVTVERDTAVTGTFRMESDNAAAQWPTMIIVNAFLALDGAPLLNGAGAEGAPAGRFVLRNAFGPRVLRCGYSVTEGSPWWPTRVLLDGSDVTNVPTDFSTHENGQLEIVFTQHPARLAGTVNDRQGRPVRGAWVLVFGADRSLWQPWATTSHAVQADEQGAFRFASLPGRYLVRVLPPTAFPSERLALKQMERYASGAVSVELGQRERKMLRLAVQDPYGLLALIGLGELTIEGFHPGTLIQVTPSIGI